MSLSIARCPNCGSTFNISRRRLDSSAGLARCGACLRVFLAADNLLDPDEGAEPADSVFIGHAPEEYFSPDSFLHPPPGSEDPEPTETVGETHASPLPHAETTHRDSTKPPRIAGATHVPIEPPDPVGATHASPAPSARTTDEDRPEPPEFEEQFEILPEEGREALMQVTPALNLQSGESFNWGAFVGLTTVALMLVVVLAAQYLWRYLPVYSQMDWLRPGYAQICARVDCELPVYSRVGLIRNDSTALRTHPDYPNAYLLAAQFHNAARFPQPFPVLVLRFSSLDARTVAIREFAPAEYLHADLLALGLMPPNSPVQVELEVINPGPLAVNYEVSFRAP